MVAQMTPEGRIVERVVYDPYGRGRHHYAADYDGNGAVEVADLNGTYGHLTAWFADDMQADWDRDGTTYGDVPDIFAFQTDWFAQSGNAVAAGQISRRYAAGSGINANAPDNVIGYCGYVFNPETDDYTVRFRHYDPEIGRWLERDPAGYVDGMNRFAIAKCSPVTRADWSGLATVSDDNHRLSDIVYGLTDHERTIVTTSQNCGAWSARGARLTACGSSVLLVDHEVTKWIELRIAGPTLQGGGDEGPLAVFSWTTTGWTVLDGRFRHMNLRGTPCSYWVNVEVDCCRTCEVQHSCEVYKRDKTWREIWKYTGESHQYSGGSRTQCRKIKIKR
ncbi:MAG: RHS repeat-associated core domain-containing protein, partial [Phycisphaeraceae bacterium]|nr:RHS repeat-associated core domain-containing protein [Phycisphaeraceae bacterium]